MRAVFSLLLVAGLMVACAPLRPALGPAVSQDFANGLMQNWLEQSSRIDSVQGLAKVQVEAPLNNINGTQVLLAESPDHLRAETLSPFGTPLLTLMADGKDLGIFLPAQSLYYIASATPENLGQFVNIPMELSDLVGALLYRPPVLKAWKQEAFSLETGGWLLMRHGTLNRQELVFNAQRQLVEVAFYEDNDLVVNVAYAQLSEQQHGGLYPNQIRLELPEKHATINLEFSDVTTNGAMRAGLFEVTPPAGVRVVYLPD